MRVLPPLGVSVADQAQRANAPQPGLGVGRLHHDISTSQALLCDAVHRICHDLTGARAISTQPLLCLARPH
eukprot:10355229-Alexandrium_andersonii.AAC.1